MRHRFADCELDEPQRALHRRGRRTKVEPKTFDLLVYLIRHRERVVLRDELVEHLWPRVSVSDSAVSKCISRAREAIGDTDSHHRTIRTFHGRGFQFVASVESAKAFCDRCASPLQEEGATCEVCEARTDSPLAVRAVVGDGERRQLSIVCCELIGTAADSAHLDDEVWSEIVGQYHMLCSEAVVRYEGYIANAFGNEVVVYFGYPRVHEDDAARAVCAGREIIAAVQKMRDLQSPELHDAIAEKKLTARIGIDTGILVVREDGSRVVALGETQNVAAGLRAVADAGTVVVSGSTLRLTRGTVTARALGEKQLAEVQRPVAAHRVLARTSTPPALNIAAGRLTPFIGRKAEVQTLVERWGRVQEHTGQTVLISGEAGIGKSRLVHSLHVRLPEGSHIWLEGRCSAHTQNTAFYPLSEIFEQALALTSDDRPAVKLRKLEDALGCTGLPLAETMPQFADLLSIPFEPDSGAAEMSRQIRRRRLIEAAVAWILWLGEMRPVVLVLEDLQWCDPSSLELLGELIAQLPTTAVMAVFTARPDFISPWPARSNVTPLTIDRLTEHDARAMVASVGSQHCLPKSAVESIAERADGNPLYLEELTRTVLESATAKHVGRVKIPAKSTIPPTLQGLLLSRLDRLGEAKRVAQLAATIGGQFSYELLCAVAGLDGATLRRHLAAIVETGLLYQRGWPPQATYVFKHALVQEAAHQSLLGRSRRRYHGEIARVLADHFAATAEREPERVARHLESAGSSAEAAAWWHRAGERALGRAANKEAIAHFRRALARLEAMPESSERFRRELEVQLGLAPALMAIEGWASAAVETACGRARDLCERLDAADRVLPALWGLWTVRFLRGQLHVALDMGEEVLAMARGSGHPMLRVMGHHAVGFTRFFRGELTKATRHAEHGIALYSPAQERAIVNDLQFSSTVALRSFLAASQWLLGHPQRAQTELDRAFALVEELAHAPSRAFFLSFRVYMHFYRGEVERTRTAAEEMLALSKKEGFLLWEAVAMIYRGWARVGQGDLDDGIDEMRQAVAMFRDTNSHLTLVQVMVALAEALLIAARAEEALRALDDGLAQAESGGERFFEAELHRLRGEIVAGRDDRLAGSCFERALDLARSQQARSLELRAATSLARLWQRHDEHAAARRLLTEVYESFSDGFETADLQRAAAVLAQLD